MGAKYEYAARTTRDLDSTVKRFAANGWRLVAVVAIQDTERELWFERRKDSPAALVDALVRDSTQAEAILQ